MLYISNDYLKAGFHKAGAELCSLKKIGDPREYIWNADPSIWSGHSPILFPIVGGLKDDSYFFDGKQYFLPRHGFVRRNEHLQVKKHSKDEIVFLLSSSEETRKAYLFDFLFEIKYLLEASQLKVFYKVLNTGSSSLYFSVGAHPAFNVPFYETESFEDYYLEFDQDMKLESHLLNESGLLKKETKLLTEGKIIELHKDLFLKDALVFKNIVSRQVQLKSKKSGGILTVEYEDFRHLGIWSKPAAPFVCIEPWLGYADVETTTQELKTKEGIQTLMPSAEFIASYTIRID